MYMYFIDVNLGHIDSCLIFTHLLIRSTVPAAKPISLMFFSLLPMWVLRGGIEVFMFRWNV